MNNVHVAPLGPQHEEGIKLVELINAALRNWIIVIGVPLAIVVIVTLWSLTLDRTYVASASFMPQAETGRAGGSAAALAQQFGVNLGADQIGRSPQFFVDLLQSRVLLGKAVESEYELPLANGEVWRGTLVAYWDLADGAESRRAAAAKLRGRLATSISRETGIVQFQVSLGHPFLAEQVASGLLGSLNAFNLSLRQQRAREEGRFIHSRVLEAERALADAEGALQDFLRQNRDFHNSPELTFEYDRLSRQVAMRQEVYTTLLRGQEQARIDGVRDTPLLTVIDSPVGSARPEPRRVMLRAAIAFFLASLAAGVLVFFREAVRRGSSQGNPHYHELRNLIREVWRDIRHPRRWFAANREKGIE